MSASRIGSNAVVMAFVKLLLLFVMAWITLQCYPGGNHTSASAAAIINPGPPMSSGSTGSPVGRLVRTKYGSLRGFIIPCSSALPITTTTSSPPGKYKILFVSFCFTVYNSNSPINSVLCMQATVICMIKCQRGCHIVPFISRISRSNPPNVLAVTQQCVPFTSVITTKRAYLVNDIFKDSSLISLVLLTTGGSYRKFAGSNTPTLTTTSNNNMEAFLGIPYAAAPVGSLRYLPPASPGPWGPAVRPAHTLPPACPQQMPPLSNRCST